MYAQLTCTGLIPADAGKTSRFGDFGWGTAGSSPLTRGKRGVALSERNRVRLIPAHAGKTRRCSSTVTSPAAHPRSRGENMACAPAFVKTRGKRVPLGAILAHDGIIPAHAGKTYPSRVTAFTLGDHPRSRGENNAVPLTAARASGSSPLTRGKRSTRCTNR